MTTSGTDDGYERVSTSKQLDSRASLETIGREFVEAFNHRDVDALLGLVSPDLEFHPTSLVGEAQVYRGHDGLRHWTEELHASQLKH
jgi:hypothetical protein